MPKEFKVLFDVSWEVINPTESAALLAAAKACQIRVDSLDKTEREHGFSQEHVNFLAAEAAKGRVLRVLIGYAKSDKEFIILDGHHARQTVLQGLAGISQVEVLVREFADLSSAERCALIMANKPQIGTLAETSKEKRRALDAYFSGKYRFGSSGFRHPLSGDRITADQLARLFGVARATIFNIVSRLENPPAEDSEAEARRKAVKSLLLRIKDAKLLKALLKSREFLDQLAALGYSLSKKESE